MHFRRICSSLLGIRDSEITPNPTLTSLLLLRPLILVASVLAIAITGCADVANESASYPQSIPRVSQGDSTDGEAFPSEQYAQIIESSFLETISSPQSTFSIDVDTASYANVRRLLREGSVPPPGAVRIEELVNYFSYSYPQPTEDQRFSITTEIAQCPWQAKHQLLRIGLQSRSTHNQARPPCNLVFLIDVSGSMVESNKLPLVKQSLRLLTTQLAPTDRIAIAVYAGSSGLVLPSTPVSDTKTILAAIDGLHAGGSTNAGMGIHLAYNIARANLIKDGINRVMLCTDGDFNVGTTDDDQLVQLVREQASSKVYLSVLGFGTGNLHDVTLEKLADRGDGHYAYIDNIQEARRVLSHQLGATLETIAKDVKIQVDFNPRAVHSYRLIGYENRRLESQDFRNDTKDAGEVGAGHAVTALYELVPATGSEDGSLVRQSEFVSTTLSAHSNSDTALTVNLRYQVPDQDRVFEFQHRVPSRVSETSSMDMQFASAVTGFGLLLRESQYRGNLSWDWVLSTAQANLGEDTDGSRREFVELAELASRICP